MTSSRIFLLILLICLLHDKCAFGLINGTKIINGQFAAHVLLQLPDEKQCGGEIISPTHVLTTSSCVLNEYNELLGPDAVTVSGKWNSTISPTIPQLVNVSIAAIYVHPKYDPYSKENDIAVLRLNERLVLDDSILNPEIASADIASRIVADQISCSLAGLSNNEILAGLEYVRLPIFNRIECNQNDEFAFRIQDNMICAGPGTSAAVCELDIGSGLYCNGMLTGILSFGASCNDSIPAVFTQARMYTEWITEQTWRNDITEAGPTPPPSVNASCALRNHIGTFYLMLMYSLCNFFLLRRH